ncbi:hypothetical protein [Halomonas sp.]|uniref:hypothetical protein n=1 Tax=Halomonas sp. TaxID=1486246 RepID=UPI003A902B14
MLNTTMKRLEALEGTLAPTPLCWKKTDCPHEAAQQYRDIIGRGTYPAIAVGHRISSDEAERAYEEIMG